MWGMETNQFGIIHIWFCILWLNNICNQRLSVPLTINVDRRRNKSACAMGIGHGGFEQRTVDGQFQFMVTAHSALANLITLCLANGDTKCRVPLLSTYACPGGRKHDLETFTWLKFSL